MVAPFLAIALFLYVGNQDLTLENRILGALEGEIEEERMVKGSFAKGDFR